jgi:hypothetical protein
VEGSELGTCSTLIPQFVAHAKVTFGWCLLSSVFAGFGRVFNFKLIPFSKKIFFLLRGVAKLIPRIFIVLVDFKATVS